jgi:electron-transferring-flavoprotein dehydrogenase
MAAAVEREVMEVDVLFVGAGPASLAGAVRLAELAREKNLGELTIAVLEKASEVGLHGFSGCVMDPRGVREIWPDFEKEGFPTEGEVHFDAVMFLTKGGSFKLPITPPPLKNHGNHVVSLAKATKWMAQKCEEAGVQIFPGFAARALLVEGGRVVGVRTDDKGIGKDGEPKHSFQPGIDMRAKIVVLGEGPRGTLTKQACQVFPLLEGRNPQNYAIGVKEIIEVPEGRVRAGMVWHTMGFPLKPDTFGGGWIYTMAQNLVSIGLVVGLDAPDPRLDAQRELQRMKTNPFVRSLLDGGRVVQYGAKTIPEGGYFAMPRLYAPGLLLVGDSGGFLNGMRLKGVHLAMKSGLLAAETCADALASNDFSEAKLAGMQSRFEGSWAKEELYATRNFHQRWNKGFEAAMLRSALPSMLGWDPIRRLAAHHDHGSRATLTEYYGDATPWDDPIPYDGKLIVDKLTDVYLSGAVHEENQPPHLLIADYELCATKCKEEFGNPCTKFCPAKVYEMVDDGAGKTKMQLAPSNCVHCKTCDIADPYLNITWVPPEAGEGPKYTLL